MGIIITCLGATAGGNTRPLSSANIGILKNIHNGENITRGTIARMLYKALDVKPTGYVYAENYSELNSTLYEILSRSEKLSVVTGILTLTENMSIESENHNPEKDSDGKKLFNIIDAELRERHVERLELITMVVDYLFEKQDNNLAKLTAFLKKQMSS